MDLLLLNGAALSANNLCLFDKTKKIGRLLIDNNQIPYHNLYDKGLFLMFRQIGITIAEISIFISLTLRQISKWIRWISWKIVKIILRAIHIVNPCFMALIITYTTLCN